MRTVVVEPLIVSASKGYPAAALQPGQSCGKTHLSAVMIHDPPEEVL
jgi:hypothetical protein